MFGYGCLCVYSLANNRVQPRGVGLRNLEAGQSAGFDDEVIHTKLDILGFHLLQRGEQKVLIDSLPVYLAFILFY